MDQHRGLEFNKTGFDGLQCTHCGEMISCENSSTEAETVVCPSCGYQTVNVRQTIRVQSDCNLLSCPPEVVEDLGTVDGVHWIFIRSRPLGRANILSFLYWFLGVAAVEAAVVLGFGLQALKDSFGAEGAFGVRLVAIVAMGLALVFVSISMITFIVRTCGWRLALSDDAVRIRCYLFGVLPWIQATHLDKSSLIMAECSWYGATQTPAQASYRDFSTKRRPVRSVLYADDGKNARPIFSSEEFDVVLYLRALLNKWRGAVSEVPCPDGISEQNGVLMYRPSFNLGTYGVLAVIVVFLGSCLVEHLSGGRMPLRSIPAGLVALLCCTLRKICHYRFWVDGDDLVCEFRILGLVRLRRYESKGAVVFSDKRLKVPTLFVRTSDGKCHRLISDVSDRAGYWIMARINNRRGQK